jgi:hypothetical protein
MKKGFLAVVLAALLVVPVAALAGMWSITDSEMEDVTGQTGVTIDMSLQVTAGYIAYGDDGVTATYTGPGFLTLAGMTVGGATGGALNLTNLTVDAGSTGTTSALIIGLPTLSGKIAFSALKLGSVANDGTSLGSLTLGDLTTSGSTIVVKAH